MVYEDEEDLKGRFSTIRDVDKISSSSSSSSSSSIKSKKLIQEVITIRGSARTVTRYYVTYSNGFRGVGWIVDSDIDCCIICNNDFGFFLRKHHCRSCGNIICHDCSDNFVIIEEMRDLGEQRVCNMCYWGQSVVYAMNTRSKKGKGKGQGQNSDDDDDEDDDSLEEEDFIIASKINASINSSVKAFHFVVNKFPDYNGEVILELGCDWKTILRCVMRDMNIYADLEVVLSPHERENDQLVNSSSASSQLGHENGDDVDHNNIHQEENGKRNGHGNSRTNQTERIKELLQQMSIKYFVLLDADGEALSPNLDNSRLFWQFVNHYSVIEKTYFMIYFNKASQSILEFGKRGKMITEEINKIVS